MLTIHKNTKKNVVIDAPPSKAHTLRAFFLAGLGEGSTIKNPLMGEDQMIALKCIEAIGSQVKILKDEVISQGRKGKPVLNETKINCGNSGVTFRFITPIIALTDSGTCIIDGNKEMRKRTIEDLVQALKFLNVKIEYLENVGYPPIKIYGGNFKGGETEVNGTKSSQYLSALMIAGACTKKGLKIKVKGNLVSKPYVDITMDLMEDFGVKSSNERYVNFEVRGEQKYLYKKIIIEGDYSNSSYFFMAAAICKNIVTIKNLNPRTKQGDKSILEILEEMGCKITFPSKNSVAVKGGLLKGISVDMENIPDLVPTVAVTAAFCQGITRISNVGHLKHKESDRLVSISNELKKMGIEVIGSDNELIITGGSPKKAEINTYNDHRIAMSFSIAGLAVEGLMIKNPKAVNKSFPTFYRELEKFY